ncbi:MAG: hypothetical protein DRH32_10515, partial [Deltaproteobacteria bacterium]
MILKETSLYGWGVCDILMPRASRDIHTDRRSKGLMFYSRNRRRKKVPQDGFWKILYSILVHDFPRIYTLLVFLLSIFMILLIYWISLILPALPDKKISKPEEITVKIIEDQMQIKKEPEPPPVEKAPETPAPAAVHKTIAEPPVVEAVREKPKPAIKETAVAPEPEPVVIEKQIKPKPKPVVVQKKAEPQPIPEPVLKETIPEVVIQPKIVKKTVEKIKKPDEAPIVFTAHPRTEIKLAPKMLSTRTLKKQKPRIKAPAEKAVKFDSTAEIPVDIDIKPKLSRAADKKISGQTLKIPATENYAFNTQKTVELDVAPNIKPVGKKQKPQPVVRAPIQKNSTFAQPVLKEEVHIAEPDVRKKLRRRRTTPALRTQKRVMPASMISQPESPDVVISGPGRPVKNYRGTIPPVKISVPGDTTAFKTVQPAAAADLNLPEAGSGGSRYARTDTPRTQNRNIIASGPDVNFKPQLNTEEVIPGPMSPGRKTDERSQAGQTFAASDRMVPDF